jgi:hypothetical protein
MKHGLIRVCALSAHRLKAGNITLIAWSRIQILVFLKTMNRIYTPLLAGYVKSVQLWAIA